MENWPRNLSKLSILGIKSESFESFDFISRSSIFWVGETKGFIT